LLERGRAAADWQAISDGLALTGYFLEHHVLAPHHQKIPAARDRLLDRIQGKISA
jgi:hypothetical protein